MIWVLLSVLAGLGDSFSFFSMKKIRLDPMVIIVLRALITLPFLSIGFLFYNFVPISTKFVTILIINSAIIVVALILIIKSLKLAPFHKSVPMLSFTPVFLLLTSYLMLGEFPTTAGLFGILLVVLGAYFINLTDLKEGFTQPIKNIFKNKGIRYMFFVSIILSIAANLTKTGIQLSNPVQYMASHYILVAPILLVFYFNKIKRSIPKIKKDLKFILLLGLSTAATEILISIAFLLTIVPYAVSLKRSSVIFSVLIGHFILKEGHFKRAIFGSSIMFIGGLLITIF